MEEKTERGMKMGLIVTGGFCNVERLRPCAEELRGAGECFVVAADSGLVTARALGAEKDVTDTVLACEIAVERGCKSLTILGGTGGRADHSLANILWVYSLKRKGVETVLTDGDNEFRALIDEAAGIPYEEGRYFSLFPIGPCAVRAVGCRYPLPEFTELTLDNPSYAVSNEVAGEKAVVEVRGALLLVRSRK